MRFNARKAALQRPGVTGTARPVVPAAELPGRVQPGDIVVIDQVDLDRETAAALLEAGVRAVVNARPMVSGRYGNLGPEVLAEAGVVLLEQVGQEWLEEISAGQAVRLHDGVVYADLADGSTQELASGRVIGLDQLRQAMEQPPSRAAAAATATAEPRPSDPSEARALPGTSTWLGGRPVVVVARGDHTDLQTLRPFVRDQAPALVAVGSVADDLLGLSWAPDVVVLTAGEPGSFPSPDALRVAKDVVIRAPVGPDPAERTTIEQLGVTPLVARTPAPAQDLALLMAHHQEASLIIGVGLEPSLEVRLAVGERLVDVGAVRTLYTGRLATAHIGLVVMAGFIALLAAVSVTPLGQDWVQTVVDYLQGVS